MKARLILETGSGKEEIYSICDVLKLGRGPANNVRLEDELVSVNHAEIKQIAGSIYLVDLNSQNGTRVNGNLITREIPVYHGDKIEIGNSTFTVEIFRNNGKAVKPFIDSRFNRKNTILKNYGWRFLFGGVTLIMIVVAAFIFFSNPASSIPPNIEPYLTAAHNYTNQGKYNDALVELEVALAAAPGNQDVITKIEELRGKAGTDRIYQAALTLKQSENIHELEKAVLKFDEVLRLAPNHSEAAKHKAEAEKKLQILRLIDEAKSDFANGHFSTAAKKFTSVLNTLPENNVAISYLELIQQNQQRRQAQARIKAKVKEKEVSVPVENHSPEIAQLYADKTTLPAGAQTQLTVVASDLDNDMLDYEWSANSGAVEGMEDVVIYVAPGEVSAEQTDAVSVMVSDQSGNSTSKSIYLTIQPRKPKVILSEAQKRQAKKLFIDGYRSEREPSIRNISRAIGLYKKVLEIAPDPDYIYYQKALSRLANLEGQENE